MPKIWMSRTLKFAGIYNLLWGASVVLFPEAWFALFGMQLPVYPEIWQCVGMIVGVYGLGYWIAASDPRRHWPIVLVGFLGKLFGPIGFAKALWDGVFPLSFAWVIVFNDLIWWYPFAAILVAAFLAKSRPQQKPLKYHSIREALASFKIGGVETALEASQRQDLLLVFLRHKGCNFCKAYLDDLQRQADILESAGTRAIVVHMSEPHSMEPLLRRYGLDSKDQISDPERQLYRLAGLGRASFRQIVSPLVFKRLFLSLIRGHSIGFLEGDGFQLGGIGLLRQGELVYSREAKDVSTPLDIDFLIQGERCTTFLSRAKASL